MSYIKQINISGVNYDLTAKNMTDDDISISGTKTFADEIIVPTISSTSDSSTDAASTAFVQSVVALYLALADLGTNWETVLETALGSGWSSVLSSELTATITELNYLDGVTSSIQDQIDTNTTDIATNTTNIETNTTDIATNTTNIATNTTDIATNTTNIATNTTNIATNTTNIATNTTDIATNTTNIETNTTDIATNTTNIATKQDELTFDTTPTEDSTNPVTSGGVYSAIEDVGFTRLYFASGTAYDDVLDGIANALTSLTKYRFESGCIGMYGDYSDDDNTVTAITSFTIVNTTETLFGYLYSEDGTTVLTLSDSSSSTLDYDLRLYIPNMTFTS